MPSSLFLVTILVLATLISADFTCTGCTCTSWDGTAALARGDSAPLCIQFIDSTTPLKKSAIGLTVDQYSTMIISGAHAQFAASSSTYGEVRLLAQTSTGMTSYAIPYAQWSGTSLSFVTNIYSLVIRLDSGIISELIWDNTCDICSSSSCLTETINDTIPTDLCNVVSDCPVGTDTTACDPKIYVTWVGTDSKGSTLTSAGLRLSEFTKYSITGLYAEAQNVASSTVSDIKSAASSVST